MEAVLAVVVFGVAGAVFMGVLGLLWLTLKLIFLPVRLVLGAIKLVIGLVVGVLGTIAMLVLAPILAIGIGGIAIVAVAVAAVGMLLPLLPFLLLGLVVWAFMKRPAAVA